MSANLVPLTNGLVASSLSGSKVSLYNYTAGTLLSFNSSNQNTTAASILVALPAVGKATGNLALGSYGSVVKVLNSNTGTVLFSLTGHTFPVTAIASLGTNYIATGSSDMTIKIWNATNGALIQNLTGHTADVTSIVGLPDGLFASASSDNNIKIWNLLNCSVVFNLTGQSWVNANPNLVLLPNGLLATGPDNTLNNPTLWFWNYTTGTSPYKYTYYYPGYYLPTTVLTVLPTGNVAAAFEMIVNIINSASGNQLFSLNGHTSTVSVISSLSPDLIATGSSDLNIRIWSATGVLLQVLNGHSYQISSVVPLANGFMSSDQSYVKIWNYSSLSKLKLYVFLK